MIAAVDRAPTVALVDEQPVQVKLVGLFVQFAVIVIVAPTDGVLLLGVIVQAGIAGPACVQLTAV